jgi:acyl-CoA synthetase (AMP-forming)/AMP-acid ligase II
VRAPVVRNVADVLIHPGALFADAARRFADRPAFADRTSYRELDEAVSQVVSGLAALDLGAGERVGVLSYNHQELVPVWLGLERAGLVRVVLHSHFEIETHARMLLRTGARALVFDTRFADAVESVRGELDPRTMFVALGSGCPEWAIPLDELPDRGRPRIRAPEVPEDAPVCIQPTTGTTGAPKPWVVSHRAWTTLVLHNTLHLGDMCPLGEEEVNLHVHALQWASGAQTLLPYMLCGARTLLLDDQTFDPVAVAVAIRDGEATGVLVPGPMLTPVLDAIEEQPGFSHRLRRLVTLFATPEQLDRATRLLGPVWCHGYGSTEQGAPVARLLARDAAEAPASVGRRASPLIEISVVDAVGEAQPAGRVGEIVVRSPMSCGRYWDEEELTARAFHAGQWFRSGDLGRLDERGFLTYVDRSGDAIQATGATVYPHEVEAAVLRHPAVAGCGAVGIGTPGAQEVVAAVLLKPGQSAEAAQIAAVAADLLSPSARPRVVIVDELPVVLGGTKVKRDVLRDQLLQAAA